MSSTEAGEPQVRNRAAPLLAFRDRDHGSAPRDCIHREGVMPHRKLHRPTSASHRRPRRRRGLLQKRPLSPSPLRPHPQEGRQAPERARGAEGVSSKEVRRQDRGERVAAKSQWKFLTPGPRVTGADGGGSARPPMNQTELKVCWIASRHITSLSAASTRNDLRHRVSLGGHSKTNRVLFRPCQPSERLVCPTWPGTDTPYCPHRSRPLAT